MAPSSLLKLIFLNHRFDDNFVFIHRAKKSSITTKFKQNYMKLQNLCEHKISAYLSAQSSKTIIISQGCYSGQNYGLNPEKNPKFEIPSPEIFAVPSSVRVLCSDNLKKPRKTEKIQYFSTFIRILIRSEVWPETEFEAFHRLKFWKYFARGIQ